MKSGHIVVSKGGRGNQKFSLVHRLIAEKALGKPLPPGVEVHHWDENPANNDPSNLVICPYQRANRARRNANQRAWRAAQREKGL